MKKEEENSPPAQRLKGKSGKWKVESGNPIYPTHNWKTH